MNCATSSALAAVAADCFYAALKATEDLDPFLRTVRGGMREAAAAAASECVGRFDREVAAQVPRHDGGRRRLRPGQENEAFRLLVAQARGGRGMGASPAPQVAREERVDPAVPPQPRAAARSKDPRGRPRSRRPPFARPDDGPASPGGAPPRRPGFQPDLLCYDSLRRAPIGPA